MTDANQQAPKVLDLPIGLGATGMRREFDSLGDVEVPADRYRHAHRCLHDEARAAVGTPLDRSG